MKRRKLVVLIMLLFFSIWNFYRIKGDENIRPIQFLTIFVIGALSGLLINSIVNMLKERNQQSQ